MYGAMCSLMLLNFFKKMSYIRKIAIGITFTMGGGIYSLYNVAYNYLECWYNIWQFICFFQKWFKIIFKKW